MTTGSDSAAADNTGAVPPTKFAQARGARIAYQDFGQGPTVIAVPPLAQNVEVAWERAELRAMFERFGSFSRWIQFDKRGTGASDRRSRVPGLDERVDDVRAVMDHAGVDHAFLYGASEGGPMCLLFAVTYPDRVDGLILHDTTASYVDSEASEEARAEAKASRMSLASTWGTPESPVADLFSPSLAHDDGYRAWWQRYERLAADQDSLRELLEILGDFDVRDVLPQIDVPTLVMHRKGDQVIPIKYGRALASAIAGAQLVEHEGDDHFAFVGDQGWLDDLERFVTGTVQDRPKTGQHAKVMIRTLGRFCVEVDGEEVPTSAWGSRLARQLCKRLVAARGWPVTREELFEMLWPGETDLQKLGARLSVQLSAVRRVLGGAIIADRQTVALNLDEVSTDLEALNSATDDEEIVDLYSGPFLAEDLAEEWTNGARDETALRFTQAARRLGALALVEGDNDKAAVMARRLIDADRYDEDAYALLVSALVACGETTGARRAHAAWTKALAELDVEVPAFE